jgi:hypothetical protein
MEKENDGWPASVGEATASPRAMETRVLCCVCMSERVIAASRKGTRSFRG